MSEFTASRWSKDEKDRIYVNRTTNGKRESVGYVDVKTGYTRSNFDDVTPEEIYETAATYAVANMIGLPAPKFAANKSVTQHSDDIARNKAGTSLTAKTSGKGFRKIIPMRKPDSWEIGSEGEREVGKLFDKAKDIQVLHSVVVNQYGADIDHVLFTPNGVYTVNTKTHPGATVTVSDRGMFVNGTAVNHISKAQIEAERVSRVLTRAAQHQIPVTPVIVIARARELRGAGRKGVIVCTPDDVLATIRGRGTILTSDQISWLYERARRPETWHAQ